MAASTIPAAKAALVNLLTATMPAGVTVRWGGPTNEGQMTDEMSYLGDVTQSEEWVGLKSAGRVEDYTIELVITVRSHEDNEQTAETRLWQLRELAAGALRADPHLGGVLNEAGAELAETRQDNLPLTDGWACRARVTVHCRSRI